MTYDRCEATYNTARCSYQAGHYGPHYTLLNHHSWTAPGQHHTTTHGDAA